MASSAATIADILHATPALFRGPGGALAVVRDGQLVAKHVWGYADLNERIPMTAETLLPICSITKQMVCMMVMSVVRESPDPDEVWRRFDAELRQMLPAVFATDAGRDLSIHDLCNNQSGLRDYWAMSVLWGARPEDVFDVERDAAGAVERTRSLHFAPGTEFSYCNLNFHLVARILERVSGQPLARLLDERLFRPAGMRTARLHPDNGDLPGPIVGYEGDERHGYLPAVTRMQWSGDAGVVASLDDMIAYERHLHAGWEDPRSLYRAVAATPTYRDGAPATYGYGLAHTRADGGRRFISHSGGLRGFRLKRAHAPDERLSVLVMLNHETDAHGVARHLFRQILRVKPDDDEGAVFPSRSFSRWRGHTGAFLDGASRLKVEVALGDAERDEILLTYAGSAEKLKATTTTITDDGDVSAQAESETMSVRVEGHDTLIVRRHSDHRTLSARRLATPAPAQRTRDFLGEYHCAEIESTLHVTGAAGGGDEGGGGGMLLYGAFDGPLGRGPMHLARHVGEDVCALSCPRGLDAPAPGDWTLDFARDTAGGRVDRVTVGCWLAKGVVFVRRGGR